MNEVKITLNIRDDVSKNTYITLTSTELKILPTIGTWLFIVPKKNSLDPGRMYKVTKTCIRLDNNYHHYATDVYCDIHSERR